MFSEEAIVQNAFEWVDPSHQIIQYQGYSYDLDTLSEDGFVIPEKQTCRVNVQDLRTYLHADPTHKLDDEMKWSGKSRPSEHAIAIVGVAPDGHAFLLDHWARKDADLGKFVQQMMRMMRRWNVYRATYESYGAQIWLPQFIEQYEKMQRNAWMASIVEGAHERSSIKVALSSRLEESNKGTNSKDWIFRELLSPWVNYGILHFHLIEHHKVIGQMLHVEDETVAIDVIDAMSQGPEIWKAPVTRGGSQMDFQRRKSYVQSVRNRGMKYHSPYRAAR